MRRLHFSIVVSLVLAFAVLGPAVASAPQAVPVKGGAYKGKTSQRLPVSLRVSPDGTKLATLTIKWNAKCVCVDGGGCAPTVNFEGGLSSIEGVPIRKDGSFSLSGDATLKGKFLSTRLVKGTWRERPLIPNPVADLKCDTGTIKWSATARA